MSSINHEGKKKYIVINSFPGNNLSIGTIILEDLNNFWTVQFENGLLSFGFNPGNYPHLFMEQDYPPDFDIRKHNSSIKKTNK